MTEDVKVERQSKAVSESYTLKQFKNQLNKMEELGLFSLEQAEEVRVHLRKAVEKYFTM